jgi:predicted transcriptional regulator
MSEGKDILISVEARHAANLLSGSKTVELRRRRIGVPPGSRVWIYSKLPKGCVEALGIVNQVVADVPRRIWRNYGHQTGISHAEFFAYFSGIHTGHALVFDRVEPLTPGISLERIRARFASFQPPQFFRHLPTESPELLLFRSALA